ncbi:MAG: hypothetical protein V1934_04535 [Methanobacteriota archaeon]
MWLVTSLIAAIAVTAAWRFAPKIYRMDILSLMLWGLTMMILVDHVLGYEGGAFLQMETDGLVQNGVVLGIIMLVPVVAIWGVCLGLSMYKKNAVKG